MPVPLFINAFPLYLHFMNNEHLQINMDGSEEDAKTLESRLEHFNKQQAGFDDSKPLRISVREENDNLIGGLVGVTGWGWLYVSVLIIDEGYRGQGLGTRLLMAAEQEALRRGCADSCLTTFTFQARPFYERHGYEIFGELDAYPRNEKLFFMRKRLVS